MPELAADCGEAATSEKEQQKGRAEVKRGKTVEARAKAQVIVWPVFFHPLMIKCTNKQGMTMADLAAAQEAMFAQAREQFLKQQSAPQPQ